MPPFCRLDISASASATTKSSCWDVAYKPRTRRWRQTYWEGPLLDKGEVSGSSPPRPTIPLFSPVRRSCRRAFCMWVGKTLTASTAQFDSTILNNLAFSCGVCVTYRECALFASSKMRTRSSARSGFSACSSSRKDAKSACSSSCHSADFASQNSSVIFPSRWST